MPVLLPDAPLITFETIRAHFSQLVLHGQAEPARFAVGVLDYARREIPFDQIASTTEPHFHVWGAAALVLAALASPQVSKPLLPFSILSPDYVRTLLTKIAGLGADPTKADDSIWLQLQRIISLQPSFQGDSPMRFFQMLFLLELVDSRAETLPLTSPYDRLFQGAIGCTAIDYLGLLFGFYAQSLNTSVFDLDTFFGGSANARHLKSLAERIFATEGCLQEKVGTLLDGTLARHQEEGLVQAFVVQYPFVSNRPTGDVFRRG